MNTGDSRNRLRLQENCVYRPMNTTIPVEIASVLLPFAAVFTKPVWCHVQTLLMGAILTTGKRTITSVLVVMGLNQEEHFQNYHRVLNIQQTIWYSKVLPTFSDALALVRRFLWASTFSTSSETTQMIKVPRLLFERLRDIAIYAA